MMREAVEYGVLIAGGCPSGLAAAIRLKQLAAVASRDVSVCVLEKASEIGAHVLSGAVIDPRALNELLPDWKAQGAPIDTPVEEDRFLMLTASHAYRIPQRLLPPLMNNHGNYIVSLGNVCRWLAQQAEALDVEIYPGFPAAEVLYGDDGQVRGVATGDLGVAKDGTHKAEYQPGMELHARYTLFAEGCRGSLSEVLIDRYKLRDGIDRQKYGIGLKELWQVAPAQHQWGLVVHSQGWPARSSITSTTTWSPSASSSISTMPIRTCRRTTSSSGSSCIPPFARHSKAASGSCTARAPSTKAACNPSRG